MAEPSAKKPRLRTPALAPHLTKPAAATPAGSVGGGARRPAPVDPLGGLFAGLPEASSTASAPKDSQKIPEAARPVTHVRVLHLLKKHTGSRRPSSWREKVIRRSVEEAMYELKEFRKKIVACEGKDKQRAEFEKLARKESDCSSAQTGGDLGRFGRGKMQPQFEEASFALSVNELSGIVASDSGLHLILRLE